MSDTASFLAACRAALGEPHVLTSAADMAPFLTDWRDRFTGKALAVLRPASVGQVAAVVRACAQWQVPLVPQGGNTGLVLGSIPDAAGTAVVLSLARLNAIRRLDPVNRTVTVDAGCILQHIQEAAAAAGCLFPLSLAAEGSCTIGGNLSTNAGGTAVLRYGNTRELCLGLEVVTPQGEIWSGLRGLRKDNTGYDLRDLYIGAEGTLGIITGAVLKLYPQPKACITALAALPSPAHALQLLTLMQDHCGASLTGFELMSQFCLELVAKHYPQLPRPFATPYAQYVLLELSSSQSEAHAIELLESSIGAALEGDIIEDAVVASSVAQSDGLWQLREHIPLAQAAAGKNIKHDISLPISCIADFIAVTDQQLAEAFPGSQMVCFGHLGDGNLHYNVAPPDGMRDRDFLGNQEAINRVVHDSVDAFGGSISAEHGIGALKKADLAHYKSALELQLMRAVKQALDPLGIMNPGKIL
ncbi:FAD-binding oxidoreductase [Janthinobacterium agaricidamnosum]|uniref:FAD linked oxidases, C-terminal domain protein n=1 Tax=Janthinobacterium agaricidamnosum NBRC 102515 = DSM 9628 TaxID=1349767 RepID=W0V5K0_9BURK|nr:FAD-binding oxidoreductase [Janthinobacterium agaricidamnosum]CDG82880.1 FAD linked oxidases, C-terminal domain protein [Janthinobacterium agaricidamnosum NBRC 102515 = DSM 9628]